MSANSVSHWKTIYETANNADARFVAFKNFFADPELPNSSSWLGIGLQGVQDVWSVIRKFCVGSIANQFHKMMRSNDASMTIPLRFMHFVQLSRAAKKSWFSADGLLLLTKELSKSRDGRRLIDVILSESERVQLGMTHVLELVVHEQLQVRTCAIEVIAQLCEESAVMHTILSVVPFKIRCGLSGDSPIAVMEGLLELVLFFPTLHASIMDAQRAVGLRLASHEAATVRQRFADFIAKAHGANIMTTIDLLFSPLGSDAETTKQWMQVETLLMALQSQLTSIAYDNATELFPRRAVENSIDPESVLLRLLRASACEKFEVRRMGEQVLPLYCQYLVHREPPKSIVPLLLSELLKGARERLCWFLMLRRVVSSFLQLVPAYAISAKTVVEEIDAALMFHVNSEQFHVAPLVRIMLACYGPHFLRRLATQADWDSALTDPSSSSMASRYAPDFALLSSVSVFVVEHWVHKLIQKSTPSHEQLLLLEAIRNLIANGNTQHGLLLFTSRDDFRPPSLLDGGDDVPEGFTWLHGMLPNLPKRTKSYSCNIVGDRSLEVTTANAELQELLDVSINVNPSDHQTLPLSVNKLYPLFDTLLMEPAVEPRVVTVLSSILADLYRRNAVELANIHRWVILRLDTLYGRASWVQSAASTCAPSKKASNSFDDSDEDDEASVAGANASTELRQAREFFATIYGYNLVSREVWIESMIAELSSQNSACIEALSPF
ncbi:Hypothetical protein, putative [Bodo saltans]|uniref:Uncharacterized protein n=1 Tax=Bodo saltans TaxID=75058 RepID=A0A0S4JVI2_BODSA|nr:Hypothetical protein, putative [Bodo saltans]|eukprot:CUG93409.1 Hypothetical protein, putative [Bodo saltans]